MVEIKNVHVFGLTRAVNAVSNSFTVGEIDTTKTPTERTLKVARGLGSDRNPHQSHDAWLAGVVVDFDISDGEPELALLFGERYFTLTHIENRALVHVNTNFRALKHFCLKQPKCGLAAAFRTGIYDLETLTGVSNG